MREGASETRSNFTFCYLSWYRQVTLSMDAPLPFYHLLNYSLYNNKYEATYISLSMLCARKTGDKALLWIVVGRKGLFGLGRLGRIGGMHAKCFLKGFFYFEIFLFVKS